MTPEGWITACTDRLVELITDEGVTREDLAALAADMAEDERYSTLTPAAAAELHARDFA